MVAPANREAEDCVGGRLSDVLRPFSGIIGCSEIGCKPVDVGQKRHVPFTTLRSVEKASQWRSCPFVVLTYSPFAKLAAA